MLEEAIACQVGISKIEAVAVLQEIVSPEATKSQSGVKLKILEATVIPGEYIFSQEEAADTYKGKEPSVFVDPNLFKKDMETFFIGSEQISVADESAPTDADYYTTTSLENVKNTDAGA